MKTFLERGIDVNIRGEYQWTALINAANRGHLTSLKLLLDADADPDLKSASWNTALILAAKDNYPEIVSELLRRGADNNIEYDGKTAQQWAEAEEEGNQDADKADSVHGGEHDVQRSNQADWSPRTGTVPHQTPGQTKFSVLLIFC